MKPKYVWEHVYFSESHYHIWNFIYVLYEWQCVSSIKKRSHSYQFSEGGDNYIYIYIYNVTWHLGLLFIESFNFCSRMLFNIHVHVVASCRLTRFVFYDFHGCKISTSIYNIFDPFFQWQSLWNKTCSMKPNVSDPNAEWPCLTHLPLVPHICVSESGQRWFR